VKVVSQIRLNCVNPFLISAIIRGKDDPERERVGIVDWIRIDNMWVAESGELSFSVRWTGGSWHWRAVYCEGPTETAQFAGDNKRDQPYGFLTAQDAMRAAERWYEILMGNR